MPDVAEPITKCLKCGGPVWDNRKDKRSPKAPDFKCRDKENCGEGFWLAKGVAAARARETNAEPRYRELLGQDAHETETIRQIQGAAAPTAPVPALGRDSYEEMQTKMAECFKFVYDLYTELQVDLNPQAMAQMTDTLFIQRVRAGV